MKGNEGRLTPVTVNRHQQEKMTKQQKGRSISCTQLAFCLFIS